MSEAPRGFNPHTTETRKPKERPHYKPEVIKAVGDTLGWWAKADDRDFAKNTKNLDVIVPLKIAQAGYYSAILSNQEGYKASFTNAKKQEKKMMMHATADGMIDFLRQEIAVSSDGDIQQKMEQALRVLEENSQVVPMNEKRQSRIRRLYEKEFAFARSGQPVPDAVDKAKARDLLAKRREFVIQNKTAAHADEESLDGIPETMAIGDTMLTERKLPESEGSSEPVFASTRLTQHNRFTIASAIERTRRQIARRAAKRSEEATQRRHQIATEAVRKNLALSDGLREQQVDADATIRFVSPTKPQSQTPHARAEARMVPPFQGTDTKPLLHDSAWVRRETGEKSVPAHVATLTSTETRQAVPTRGESLVVRDLLTRQYESMLPSDYPATSEEIAIAQSGIDALPVSSLTDNVGTPGELPVKYTLRSNVDYYTRGIREKATQVFQSIFRKK